MSGPFLPIDAVLDRLAEGPWRLEGLPTIRGRGLYFVALELGDDPSYAWFATDKDLSASRTTFFDRAGATTFLTEYAKDGYVEELLQPWADDEAATFRRALRRTRRLFDELRAHPGTFAPAMETGWLERTSDLGWLVTKAYEKGPSQIQCGETRAASELLTQVLRHEPELERGTPPPELVAAIDEAREHRAAVFAEHGPSTERLLLQSREGANPRGLMRFASGRYAQVELDADGALEGAELVPDDHAFDRLQQELRSVVPARSAPLPAEARALAERLLDIDALALWHESGAIRMRCGKFARGGFMTLDRQTLLDDVSEKRLGVRAAIERFADTGFVAIEVATVVSASEQARAEDDPESPSLRYMFPKVWLHRLSKNRVFELAFGTALTSAVGSETTLARREERLDRGEHCAEAIRVTLRAGTAKVVIEEEPIESGHGVHGAQVRATFHGLPGDLVMSGTGRIDMRGGGHLALQVDGDPAKTIKRDVLDVLP